MRRQVRTARALPPSLPRPTFARKRRSGREDATGRGSGHGKGERPAEIIETIAQSIRVSQRGARKVKAHRFKELFGYQVLNTPRREKIEQLMAEAGIEVRSALKDAGRDDWLVMSMPVEVPVPQTSPDEFVKLITTAGIDLPAKPLERVPPFRRRRGPLAEHG